MLPATMMGPLLGSGTKPTIDPVPALLLFCSYCHKDETLRRQLEIHLSLLHRHGVIASWHDRQIGAGQEWKEQISSNLERADIILLLVSADFMASDYCYDIEMRRALERHEEGTARVIPVIVRDVDWSVAPFSKLQALPRNGKAVRRWSDRDAAWRNVVEGIKTAAVELRKTRD
jgi:internalin A